LFDLNRVWVVAEVSGNHGGDLSRALAIIDAAADAGADAVKFQTYTADTMTLPRFEGEFVISDPNSLWHGRSLYDLYQEAHTPWEWHGALFEHARRRGLLAFSSPFDPTAVDFLETLNPPAYKIASFELVDLPLIRRVAATGKPVILSTGMATEAEIAAALSAAQAAPQVILLKCTSTYPAPPEDSHLRMIPTLSQRFGCPVGLSDHTLGLGVAVAAVALGAVMIEKHLTLDVETGIDSAFSATPDTFKTLVAACRQAAASLGSEAHWGPTPCEVPSLLHRRSWYVVADIPAGGVLTPENVRAIRPGLGLPPGEAVLGCKARHPLRAGQPLQSTDIENR
jgi:pseudaminic acid synthase